MMKRTTIFLVLSLVFGLFPGMSTGQEYPCLWTGIASWPEVVIEDFDDGSIELVSFPGEDLEPDAWELNSQITYENSPWSLKLFGNTWKVENIPPLAVDSGEVWQISAYIASTAEVQAFGIMDSAHALFYSFAGTQELYSGQWVPVYQGSLPQQQWNVYQLPIADDWLASYGYLPVITGLVFANDRDYTSQGAIYFDLIADITDDLPIAPEVTVSYIITKMMGESVEVQFLSGVTDPDSEKHDYYWDFGDGTTSIEHNPLHSFLVSDDHPYTVLLQVVDSTGRWGRASCCVDVDPGVSSFPVTLNFVGDIMLAREYEGPGGIIPTLGVEAIFEPTKPWLGDAAQITVANCECTYTTYWQHHPTKPIYFKGSPANVAGLAYAGIDLVSLANNHILDYLLPGLQETQSVLKTNNILYSGAGACSYEAYLPAFLSVSGVNIAFLAASDRTGLYNNYQPYLNAGCNKPGFAFLTDYYTGKQIEEAKKVSDLVVLEWHAGNEYSFVPDQDGGAGLPPGGDEDYSPLYITPSEGDLEARHAAIDNGADLVICHHPHIIHGLELYHGRLIAHSLGNFVFDLHYPETYPSMILGARVDETGFYEFSIVPVYIDDFIPLRAEGELGLYILDYLAQRSRELDTYVRVDRDSVVATIIMDTLNMLTSTFDTTALLPLEKAGTAWETPPCRLRRAGSITSIDGIWPAGSFDYRLGRELLWFGNMEDEGCTLWELNNSFEKYCDTVAYAGERSLQHQRDPSSPYALVTDLEDRIFCPADTLQYSLCGYIRTLNGSGVTIAIDYYVDREYGSPIGQEDIGLPVNGDTPWTFYHHSLTIPAGTRFFDVRLVSQIPASDTAFAWFDNVGVVCWNAWKGYTQAQSIPGPNDYYFLQVRSMQNVNEVEVDYSETVYEDFIVGSGPHADRSPSFEALKQNFPNPFNPRNGSTRISFSLGQTGRASLVIYDLKGQAVRVVADGVFQAGMNQVCWDGCDTQGHAVSPGVYVYHLEARGVSQTKKCLVLPF